MTIEGYDAPERILVSYDVVGEARSTAARVCQIVFGRGRFAAESSHGRRAKGFIDRPGVVWIGQSVLALPPHDAEELREKLVRIGVRVVLAQIAISHEALEAFRRTRREVA
ncbi:MAG TPA: hypothetical protein VJP06_03555 [Thermoplasmata archaeon]|nr:hypothetical protein [Thermoplasmata archaeon]